MNENKNNVSPVSQTPDSILKDKLKQLIPEAFSEGKLNIDTLKAVLGENVLTPSFEAYGLNWAGKHEVYRELKTPTSQTLLPQPDESVDFDKTQNLFIEGDNLAVLKILQKSYYNRIKMIYIDPPYNTGNDRFIYPDDYSESIKAYKERAGQTDDEGNLTHSDGMRSNSKENGQYHSNWLNMMYPRLALAKNLLRDDGVIFISIGIDEIANLKLVMDEIYGEENYVDTITWNKRVPKNDKGIGNIHEYILIYVKNNSLKLEFKVPKDGIEEVNDLINKFKVEKPALKEAEDELRKLYKNKNFDRGITLYNSLDENYEPWGKINLSWPNANTFGPRYEVLHPITKMPVNIPDRGWRWKKETFNDAVDYENVYQLHDGSYLCGRIWFDKDENTQPSSVLYLKDVDKMLLRTVLSLKSDGGIEVEKMFGKSFFSYPKPTNVLKTLISSLNCNKNDEFIVLDFFAGSSTTAHAVMALNAEEANNSIGKRKFIMVQIPEAIDPKDNKNAYEFCQNNNLPPTIAEISKERIRRAGQQILADNPDLKDSNLDIGFKTYKLSDSNFVPWQQPDNYDAESLLAQLEKHVNPIVDDATDSGLVTELMLKEGYTLTASIEQKDGYYLVTQDESSAIDDDSQDNNKSNEIMTLAVVLENMTTDKANQIIKLTPSKTIILDNAFSDDANKANIILQFEDAGLVVGCV